MLAAQHRDFPLETQAENSSTHKRCKSFPEKKFKKNVCDDCLQSPRQSKMNVGRTNCAIYSENQVPMPKLESSLKKEIIHLEKRLHEQFAVRRALEKALGFKSSNHETSNEISMPKTTKELIKDIAVLELEVIYLERFLLSLYRKAFEQQNPSFSSSGIEEHLNPSLSPQEKFLAKSRFNVKSKNENLQAQSTKFSLSQRKSPACLKESSFIGSTDKLRDPGVHRCYSSLSQRSFYSIRTSPLVDILDNSPRICHSQPLYPEHANDFTPNVISLAEHLGTRISDHVPETPNRFSEDVVRCMSAIYSKLSDPSTVHHGPPSSPPSTSSSTSAFSPQHQCDIWSPHYKKESSFDVPLDKHIQVAELNECKVSYGLMVEISCISRDNQKLREVEPMIQKFRSLVRRLEKIDPGKLKNEEKLAFWINIHNALVMHAYLTYGIPQNNVKRLSLLLKAAYNVGGHTINADTIQNSILGCRTQRPGQWLQTLFSSKMRFRVGDDRRMYAIENPEPLVHFALCSGSHSDPALRVYTPKRVFQELESAKEDYIQSVVGIRKEQKILLPKAMELYVKDSGTTPEELLNMVQAYLPGSLHKAMKKCIKGKHRKSIEWIPHNFKFRYLLSRELVNGSMN